jgi:outer membrane protein, heavy metal efflux system
LFHKLLLFVVLLLSVSANGASLQSYLKSAIQNNHNIIAAEHRFDSAEAKIDFVGGLPDPQLRLGISLQPIETRLGSQSHSLSLSQQFPMWGKRGLQTERQRLVSEIDGAYLAGVKASVLGDVEILWWELATLDYSVEKTLEHQKLVAAQLEVAEAGYSSGGEYSDIIDVKLANDIVADSVAELRSKRIPLISKLFAMTTLSGSPDAVWQQWTPFVPELDQLLSKLNEAPELLVAVGNSKVAESSVELAGKRKLPDLTTGIDWVAIDERDIDMDNNGSDAVIARIGFNLPIWGGQNKAAEQSAAAHYAFTQSIENNTRLLLIAELESLVSKCESAVRRHKLYNENLLPQAEEAVLVISAAYESGHSGFADLIDAQKRVLDYELEFSKACLDGRTAISRMNIILGNLPEGI